MRYASILAVTLLGLALAGCTGPVGPDGRSQLLNANTAYQHGDDATAIASSSRFLQTYGKSQEAAEAYYIRGLARERSKQLDDARSDFQAGLKLTKRKDLAAKLNFELANMAFDAGDLPGATRNYREVLANGSAGKPPMDEALYRLGSIMQLEGNWREADEYFDKVMHQFEGSELAKRATYRVRAVRWSIQVSANDTDRTERALLANLQRDGLTPRTDMELRDGQMKRLLRVGSYPTYDSAKADLERVQKYKADAFITASR